MQISGTDINKCRLCKSNDLYSILDFGNIPLGNDLNFSIYEAHNAERYPLILNNCKSCGHFQLSFSVDKEILYQKDYSYLSSIGKTFVDHLEWSCVDIMNYQRAISIEDQIVVDIGSNDGTALSFFKSKGFKVFGIDPSNLPVQKAIKNKIETINKFFSLSLAKQLVLNRGRVDIIISHNVLAHVEDLEDVFSGIYYLLKEEGLFVFEVGYFAKMVQAGIYDTIYHEHLDYHSFKPILKFLNEIGFSVVNVNIVSSQGGSLRIYCKKQLKIENNAFRLKSFLDTEKKLLGRKEISLWENKILNNSNKIKLILKNIKEEGGKLYAYGAPTKASLACKMIEIKRNDIELIIEDNPIKVGRYLPYLGIPILSNIDKSISDKDLIICFAWNFLEDIIYKIRKKYGSGIRIISSETGKIIKT